jgi:hypothetical protein
MRVMALVLASMLAVFVVDGQAFAAKRTGSSGVANPDRQYYQGAGSCMGAASCYRSGSQKHQKKH